MSSEIDYSSGRASCERSYEAIVGQSSAGCGPAGSRTRFRQPSASGSTCVAGCPPAGSCRARVVLLGPQAGRATGAPRGASTTPSSVPRCRGTRRERGD